MTEKTFTEKTLVDSGFSTLEDRKQQHLDLCRNEDVAASVSGGLESVILPHKALPEINFAEIRTEQKFLGHVFSAPILISGMTGGSPSGDQVNRTLAEFAELRKIPMGVGSQRIALKNRDKKLFDLRKVAPKAVLFANIGAVQLNYDTTVEDCQWIVDQLEAQALVLHANALQEAIQFEGDRNFSQLLHKIAKLKKAISVPLILKETGCGIDAKTCVQAREAGVDVIDIAGLGGTHWGFIEGLRHESRRELGQLFRSWGIPTARAVEEAREALGPNFPLIASGGLRSGLDVAKVLYLGADFAGMALPFLKSAQGGLSNLNSFLDLHVEALKIAMFCTGVKNYEELKAL